MKRLLSAIALAPLFLTAALSSAPNPGVVFEMEVVSQPGAAPERIDAAVEGLNARMKIAGQGDVIYRGDRREMLMINHGSKSYILLDEPAMKKLGAQLSQVMAQIEQMLKNMPEAQRAQMEQAMKGRMGGAGQAGPVEIRKTAERATHSGFPTVKYELARGGRKVQELWVTPWTSIDGAAEARPVFESMGEFFKVIQDSLKQFAGDPSSDTFGRIKEIDGYPVMSQGFDETGKPTTRTLLRAVRRQALPASDFTPPAGYKQQPMLPGM